MKPRDLFVSALKSCIGTPYKWGGSDLNGLDCSGTIIYCLAQSGMPIKDTNAQGIFNLLKNRVIDRLQAPPGALYFYGESTTSIHHVMAVCEHWDGSGIILIGAHGGDQTTITPEDAAARKAFVGSVFGDYWLDKFVVAVDPF